MRQRGALILAGLALALALAPPAAVAATYPGERPWDDPAATGPYLAAAGAALDRLYPADERHCPGGIALALADDIGLTTAGTPASASGADCRIVLVSAWTSSAYGHNAAHKRLLCAVIAHERAHAELGRPHVADPGDLMFPGELTVALPECAAAFPDPGDGFIPPGGQRAVQPVPPPGTAVDDEPRLERICLPAWAGRSTRAVRRYYVAGYRVTARRLYKRWARRRPAQAAAARARGRHCEIGERRGAR